jgi:hypothetical protein
MKVNKLTHTNATRNVAGLRKGDVGDFKRAVRKSHFARGGTKSQQGSSIASPLDCVTYCALLWLSMLFKCKAEPRC